VVKIADFGLARQGQGQASLVMKSVVGTITFSCPEIVTHQEYTHREKHLHQSPSHALKIPVAAQKNSHSLFGRYSHKADMWSLGCVLYQMAMLEPPFTGTNPLAVAQQIVHGKVAPLSNSLSPLLREVCTRLLSVKPETRPDIGELLAMIAPQLVSRLASLSLSHDHLQEELLRYMQRPL
jgi:serine/threonine protein kinase